MDCADCDAGELEVVDRLFDEQIFPVLTPLAVGPGRPFPYISNLSLSIAVWLRDPVGGDELFARVKVPKEVLPRLLPIGDAVFVPLESVIARHLGELFPGMEVVRHAFFRVTRDADFTVSDEADDLLRAVEDELRRRRFGEAVRLEVSHDMDPRMRDVPDRAARDRRGARWRTWRGCSTWRTSGRCTTSTATASCATRPGSRCPSPRRARTARPTSSPPCAPATCSCTTPTTRSRGAWSASCSRPWPTPTCSRSR